MSDAGGETAGADIDLSKIAAALDALKGNTQQPQMYPESPVPQQVQNIVNRVAEESALKDNIVSYKASNTAYIDALYQLKNMGLLNAFGSQIAPFPQKGGTNIVIVGGDNKPSEQKPQEKPVQPSAPDPSKVSDSLKEEAKKELEEDDKKMSGWKKLGLAAALLGGGAATSWIGGAIVDKLKGDKQVIERPVDYPDPTVGTEVH